MRVVLVSIIIPTFNHSRFISATLRSVFAQTWSDFEVIVVNDGSTDETLDCLQTFISSKMITYVEQQNTGQAAARNRGLERATGKYVAFLDDDDLWPRDKLRWQVEFLECNKDYALVGGSVRTFGAAGTAERHFRSSDSDIQFEELFSGNPFWSPGQTLIRRDVLQDVGGFCPDVWGVDDLELWMRLAKTHKMRWVDRVSLLYRLHSQNASRDLTRMLYNTRLVIKKHVPAEQPTRASCIKASNRWLYDYYISRMVWDAGRYCSRGEIRKAFSYVAAIAPFTLALVHDLDLVCLIFTRLSKRWR